MAKTQNEEEFLDEEGTEEKPRSKRPAKKSKSKLIAIIVAIILLAAAGYFVMNRSGSGEPQTEEQAAAAAEAEIAELEERIQRLIVLPSEETPVLATITDAEALRAEQPFYASVEDGDKLLIYLSNQRAVIYRPSQDVLVNVGPIIVDNAGAPAQ